MPNKYDWKVMKPKGTGAYALAHFPELPKFPATIHVQSHVTMKGWVVQIVWGGWKLNLINGKGKTTLYKNQAEAKAAGAIFGDRPDDLRNFAYHVIKSDLKVQEIVRREMGDEVVEAILKTESVGVKEVTKVTV